MKLCKLIQLTCPNILLSILRDKGLEINHLKLQKLIYYIDAWHYVFLDKPLIRNDFEAWMHGPVVREVWDHYKNESILNGTVSITNPDVDISTVVSPEQIEVINDVLDEYGDKTSYYLECLTHEEDPWRYARKGYSSSDRCERIIPKAYMKQFYEGKLYAEEEE